MDKVAQAKKLFYNTLRRSSITPEEYISSAQGVSILKLAAHIQGSSLEKSAKSKSGGKGMLKMIDAVIRKLALPDDPVGNTIGYMGIGGLAGYTTARTAAKLTSPTDASIGNLQKREEIAELDSAIEELRNRMEDRSM